MVHVGGAKQPNGSTSHSRLWIEVIQQISDMRIGIIFAIGWTLRVRRNPSDCNYTNSQ